MTPSRTNETGETPARSNETAEGLAAVPRLVGLVRSRPWVLVLSVLAGLAVGLAFAARQSDSFVTETSFSIRKRAPLTELFGEAGGWPFHVISALPVAEDKEPVHRLKTELQSRRFLIWALRKRYPGRTINHELVDRIRRRMTVTMPKMAPILVVRYESPDPGEGARLLGYLPRVFLDYINHRLTEFILTTRSTTEQLLNEEAFGPAKRQSFRRRIRDVHRALTAGEAGGGYLDLTVLNEPHPVSRPSFAVLPLLTGGGLGFLVGLGLVFLVDRLDPVIHGPDDLRGEVDRRPLAVLNHVRSADDGRLPDLRRAPDEAFSESIRILRARLDQRLEPEDASLLITSPGEAAGKTTVAWNLAHALVLGGSRTLLVDADLRGGMLHRQIGEGAQPGLTALLAGETTPEAAIRSVDGLDVLPRGAHPSHPVELLASSSMRSLIDRLSRRYDRVVIDGPALLGRADAAELSRHVDRVLLILRSDRTDKPRIRKARRLLRRARASVAGTVLNAETPVSSRLDREKTG